MTAGSEHGAAPDASVRVPDYEILDYIAARKPSIEHDGSRDRPEPSDQAKPIETFDAGLPGQVAGDPFDSDSHYDDDNRSEDDRSDYGAHADPQPPVPGLADLSSSAESNSTLASSGIVPDFDHVAEGKAEYDATVPSSPAHGPPVGRARKPPPRGLAMRQSRKIVGTARPGGPAPRPKPPPPGQPPPTIVMVEGSPAPDDGKKNNKQYPDATAGTVPYDLLAMQYLMNYEYGYQEPDTSSGAPTLPATAVMPGEVHSGLDNVGGEVEKIAAGTTGWIQGIFCCAYCKEECGAGGDGSCCHCGACDGGSGSCSDCTGGGCADCSGSC
eukprot:TRINITY_DN7667_c0_g1_i2.p1 TRINITY_DN7667_c0_g1~~TRINITY_DN7667_c0_g1_i2.p1  ORF type:complete len:327 (+),score=93.36 TRINITY_DN7667_c0_g1_i2:232-1212(+)